MKTALVKSATLVTGQSAIKDIVLDILPGKTSEDIFPLTDQHMPKYLIFDREEDPMFRALLATGIGCDCYPGNVTGFRPKAAFEAVKALAGQTHDQRNDRIACELADNTKLVVNNKLVFR
jgi:hypothetical protein